MTHCKAHCDHLTLTSSHSQPKYRLTDSLTNWLFIRLTGWDSDSLNYSTTHGLPDRRTVFTTVRLPCCVSKLLCSFMFTEVWNEKMEVCSLLSSCLFSYVTPNTAVSEAVDLRPRHMSEWEFICTQFICIVSINRNCNNAFEMLLNHIY